MRPLLIKCAVLRNIPIALCLLPALAAFAQQSAKPKVKVNMINACAPSPAEQQEISAALANVPKQVQFAPDFEIDRGRSSLDQKPEFLAAGQNAEFSRDASVANWVRLRRDLAGQGTFSNLQYSFSTDSHTMIETLVFHVRDPKDLLQLTIEDSAAAVTTPAAMLTANTPAGRIRLERFGKSSVALARCIASADGPAPDQTALQPLFQAASEVLANYRTLLGVQQMVPEELARVHSVKSGGSAPRPPSGGNKPAQPHH